jgi:RimJ/RimL family protein N-acetyltransferase
MTPSTSYHPRRLRLRDGREVLLRAAVASDAAEIVQAFERLSADSRYHRFMQHKKQLNPAALERGVHPQPGRDFALLATIPAADGIDIVGAAQYVRANENNASTCEFAITVAEDWRGSGLATELLARLVRRAPRDGYATMEGSVIAQNTPMLALARKLGFQVEPVPEDATVVRVQRALKRAKLPPLPDKLAINTAAMPPPSDQ